MIKMSDTQPVPRETPQLIDEQVERLREIFPEAFTEGKVDFDKLRDTLGEIVDDRPERYSFPWAGKRDAIKLLQTPSRGALVPVPEESVNFEETQNVFVEGENLEVLKLLYKSYYGRVKLIYIDPPYNTGNDRVYPDNYADPLEAYLQMTGQRDAEGNLLATNPETSGRYHSNWLSMMYPRLFLARQLLREDGVIFVSIDDHEVHNLRMVMNEVFGEENFVAQLVWKKRSTPPQDKVIGAQHEYMIIYSRSFAEAQLNLRVRSEQQIERYKNPDNHPKGPWAASDLTANVKGGRFVSSLYFPIINPRTGKEHYPPEHGNWRFNRERIEQLLSDNEIYFGADGKGKPMLKRFLCDIKEGVTWTSIWDFAPYNAVGSQEMRALLGSATVFENPKPSGLIEHVVKLGMGADDIILDFFAGSCTTAQALLRLNREDGGNRRFIMVQLPEPTTEDSPAREAGFSTIAQIGKERIRRVIQKMTASVQDTLDLPDREEPEDLGFRVFHLQESNLQPWQPVPADDEEAVVNQLQRQIDPLREGWTEEAVIAEVAVKEGFGLNYRVETLDGITANCVYRVTDPDRQQTIYACLDEHLETETWEGLDLTENDLFICRDTALDDTQAANIALQCRLHTI